MTNPLFPDSFYYQDWFENLVNGGSVMDSLSDEHLQFLFQGINETRKKEIEARIEPYTQQHRRLVHDRYSDQVKKKVEEIKELMYGIHTASKKD